MIQDKISYSEFENSISKKVSHLELNNELFKIQNHINTVNTEHLNGLIETKVNKLTNNLEIKVRDVVKQVSTLEKDFLDISSMIDKVQQNIFSKVDKKELDFLVTSKIDPDFYYLKGEIDSKLSNLIYGKNNENVLKSIKSINEEIEEIKKELVETTSFIPRINKNFTIIENKLDQELDTICTSFANTNNSLNDKIDTIALETRNTTNNLKTIDEKFEKLHKLESSSVKSKLEDLLGQANENILIKSEETRNHMNKYLSTFREELDAMKTKIEVKFEKVNVLDKKLEAASSEIENKLILNFKSLETRIKDKANDVAITEKIQETLNLINLQENQLDSLNKKLENIKLNYATTSYLDEFSLTIDKKLLEKVTTKDFNNHLDTLFNKFKFENESEYKKLLSYMENSFKVFETEIEKYVNKKIIDTYKKQEKEKNDAFNSNTTKDKENNINTLHNNPFNNYNTNQSQGQNINTKEKEIIDYLSSNMVSKEEINETKSLIDNLKFSVNQLGLKLSKLDDDSRYQVIIKDIISIKEDLQTKCSSQSLESLIESQTLINDFLCSENCLGRWLWQSGTLVNKTTIPWETQVINTVPENFFWEKNQSYIVIVSKGLYDLTFGCYNKSSKCKIEVYVNGHLLLSNCKKMFDFDEVGNIINSESVFDGCNLRKVISLPSRAKLSFTIKTDVISEGFLNLKKL